MRKHSFLNAATDRHYLSKVLKKHPIGGSAFMPFLFAVLLALLVSSVFTPIVVIGQFVKWGEMLNVVSVMIEADNYYSIDIYLYDPLEERPVFCIIR